jgi:crossover junction endodeoxyribonuclease RusA
MRLTLPYPPSVNRIWRVFAGRIIKSKEGRQYAQQVAWEARKHDTQPLQGEVVVHVTAYRPQRRGDLDNTLKAAFDALNGVAWDDDSQVVELHALRLDDKTNPRLEVDVQPWQPRDT